MPGLVPDDDLPDELRGGERVPIYDLPDELAAPLREEIELQKQARGPGEPRRGRPGRKTNLAAATPESDRTDWVGLMQRDEMPAETADIFDGAGKALKRLPGNIVKSTGAMVSGMVAGTGDLLNETAGRLQQKQSQSPNLDPAEAQRYAGMAEKSQKTAKEFRGVAHEADLGAMEAVPEDAGIVERAIQAGVSSALPATAAILTAGPAGGAAVLGAGATGSRYSNLRTQGVDPNAAMGSAAMLGSLEALTEFLPGKALVKNVPGFWKKFAEFVATELPGENAVSIAQMVDDYRLNLRDDITMAEVLTEVRDTSLASLFGSAAQAGVGAGMQKAAEAATRPRNVNLRAEKQVGDVNLATSPDVSRETSSSDQTVELGREAPNARPEQASNLQALAQHEGSLLQPKEPVLSQLRGEGDQGLPGMGEQLSGVPGGATASSESAPYDRQDQERGGLRAGQSALVDEAGAGQQPAQERDADLSRSDADAGAVGAGNRRGAIDTALPDQPGRDVARGGNNDQQTAGSSSAVIHGQRVTTNPDPSPAQIKAGNYKLGRMTFQGLPIAVENLPKSVRKGISPTGKKWAVEMKVPYGFVERTESSDGEGVDVFIGPNPNAENAYVIDQLTPDGKEFDEPKGVLGADTEAEAIDIYRSHYPKNWKGMGAITAITMDRFKTWVGKGVRKEPIAWVPQAARDPNKVQVEHDSILEAIAKTKLHGAAGKGLSIEAMSKEGLDPADMQALRGMGITRPFSKKGAASLDAMAERLYELGYPVTDEDGNYSANKLLELISEEMGGNRVYSSHKEHGSPEEKRAAQIEQFMQTYEPPEKLFDIPDDGLDHYIAMLQAIDEQRRDEGEPDERVMFSREKPRQNDLFGDPVAIKNELQRLMAEKDRRRNTGQVSPETGDPGDLFSQSRNQVDAVDQAAQKNADEDREDKADLKKQFIGRDDAFWGITYDKDGMSSFEDTGISGVQCTGYACAILKKLGRERVKTFGFFEEDNPDSAIAQDAGGHDFAVVDGRFIVDPWMPEFFGGPSELDDSGVYDLERDKDKVAKLYGDRAKWKDTTPEQEERNEKKLGRTDFNKSPDTPVKTTSPGARLALQNRLVETGLIDHDIAPKAVKHFIDTGAARYEASTDRYTFAHGKAPDMDAIRKAAGYVAPKGKYIIRVPGHAFTGATLDEAVGEFVAWRDDEGAGASDIGGQFDLVWAETGGKQRPLGKVGYNGSVRITDPDWDVKTNQVRKPAGPKALTAPKGAEVVKALRKGNKHVGDLIRGDGGKFFVDLVGVEGEPGGRMMQGPFDTQAEAEAEVLGPALTGGLVDAGEKIGGARKDRWQDRGMNLSDLEGMSETEAAKLVTKAAAWKPDYAELIEGGMPVEVAAGVKVLWDKLAAKPSENTPTGRKHYLRGLGLVRTMLTDARTDQDLNALEGKLSNWLQVNWREREADGYKTFWSIQKGRRSSLGWGWNEKQSAKKLVAAGFPSAEAWTRLYKLAGTGGRGITDRGIELILKEAEEVGTPVTKEQIQEGLYYVRRKSGGSALGFATTKEGAEALAATIYEREKSGPDKDKPPERPHLDAIRRTGKTVRTRDAIPEDFLKDFGFRGIEFGNWAANDERQKLVNLAYDALHDLATVLNIPPDALSLDGRLGLALGARGGGFGVAHYEPGKLVINMTKINGAGSLAHEWGHALDHYFGELDRHDAYTTDARGATGWYKMPRLSQNENLRPAMQTAFKNLMGAMFHRDRTKAMAVREAELELEKFEGVLAGEEKRLEAAKAGGPSSAHFASRLAVWIAEYKPHIARARRKLEEVRGKPEDDKTFGKTETSYARNAARLSGKGTSGKLGYWQRPTEMFARAFESYVFDQLAGKNLESQYLVHGVEGDRYAEHKKGNPYPADTERAAINTAFDDLFATIQTRPGEKGTVLFHTEKPMTVADLGRNLSKALNDLGGNLEVSIHEQRGDIVLDHISLDRDMRGKGIGTRAMELLTQYADERGMRIILSPAAKTDGLGTTSTSRLKRFYKRFGFYENRGRRKDFTVRETMIRQPMVIEKVKVKVKENRATYTVNDRKQPAAPGKIDIFSAANNPNPVRKKVELGSRVSLVPNGEFRTGIERVADLDDAAHILAPLRKQAQENMLALVTDKDGKPLGVIRASIGVVDGASVEPWSLIGAVSSIPGAANVYFAHQHPSGVLVPSQADELITQRLVLLLQDTGIDAKGMFIFAGGYKHAVFFKHGGEFRVPIKPMPRKGRVPLLERQYTKISPRSLDRPLLESEAMALGYAKSLNGRTGIILLDNRHSVNGFFDMSHEEMLKLRTRDPETGAGKVLSVVHQANSPAVIVVGNADSSSNVAVLLEEASIRVLDRVFPDTDGVMRSAAARGSYNDRSTYTHRAREAVLVDGPITLSEVMIDNSPTMDMAENFSRLQMGHYVKMPGQTAHIAGVIHLPTSMVESLAETRASRPKMDEAIEEIANSMRVNGYDQRQPILLVVDGNGIATKFDGNHRAMAAERAGITEVPVIVTYLNGGETKDWKYSPEKLGAAAMASAAAAPAGPATARGQVKAAVDRAMAQFQVKPPVDVVPTFDMLPKAVYQRVGGERAKRGGTNAVIDFTPAGAKIYFVADRFKSDQHVTEVLMHEMTHYGLESVLTDEEWNDISHGILRDQKDRVDAIIKHEPRKLDMKNPKHQALVVHEVLAYMNQKRQSGKPFDKVEEKWWNRVMRAMREFFKRLGMTGPVYTDDYIANLLDMMTARMRSPRVQAGKGDIPGFVVPEPLANQTAPPFYSAVARAVKESKTTKASAQQWWATLNNAKGVKPEELEWLGLQDWLKEQDGPVTKEALEAYITANEIQVSEVLKGGGTVNALQLRVDNLVVKMSSFGYMPSVDMDGIFDSITKISTGEKYYHDAVNGWVDDQNGPADLPAAVLEIASDLTIAAYDMREDAESGTDEFGTRYSDAKLPGGDNYRELLLTLPEGFNAYGMEGVSGIRTLEFGKIVHFDWNGQHYVVEAKPGEDHEQAIARRLNDNQKRGAGEFRPANDYNEGHWDETNVVAHIRTTDRTDAEGKKVLFVEEIQSDWHQTGRKRGYLADRSERDALVVKAHEIVKAAGRPYPRGWGNVNLLELEQSGASEDFLREYEQKVLQSANAVPDAPFKTTWPELAFKRVLRMAAEEGYDRVAWTTGDQQNKRYSLEKYITNVELTDNASGGIGRPQMDGPFVDGYLRVYNDGREVFSERATKQRIADLIGEELAEKLVSQPGVESSSAGIGVRKRSLSGLELKVGGAGMRGFYDDMLPAMANKLTKKWGGKVGQTRLQRTTGTEMPPKSEIIRSLKDYADGGIDLDELSNQVGVEVTDGDVMHLGTDPYRKDMNRKIISGLADVLIRRGKGQGGSKQHSIDITDQMRTAALEGLPLFHREDMAEQQDAILRGEEGEGEASRKWNWLVFRAQDKFNDVLRLQNEAKQYREDMAIPEQLDAYMRETLYHGRTEYRFEQYEKDYIDPLLKLVKGSGYTYEQVEEFLYARHAPEANEYIRKITETHPDLFEDKDPSEWHSGMTDAEAAATTAALRTAGDFKKLEAIGNFVDRMTKYERDIMVSEGLVSPAEVGSWEARYKHYIPLKGWQDKPEMARMPGRGKGFDTGGKVVKSRTGRKSRAGNILATLVGQTQVTMIKAEKAKVGRAFLDFAKTHPSSLYEVNQVEMERYFDPGSMTVKERPVFRGGQKADNFLNVKVDGRDEWIEFDEENPQAMRIVRAFRNLSGKELNGLNTFLLGVNRYLSTVNTSLNPEFVISNLFRDLQTAMININATDAKDLKAQIMRDWRKAFGGIMSGEFGKGEKEWAKYFDDFKRAGAKTGWIDFSNSPADLEADLREGLEGGVWNVGKHGIGAVLGVVNKVNLAVENAIRLSVFVNARRNGLSEDKAAELAKNLTVNFNRKGDWGTELNSWYLFYNAAAQGTAVLWNAAKNKHARRVMYGLVALGIAMPIINRMIGDEDEDGKNRYDKIPEWERSSNFIIMLPKAWRWKLESGDEVDHIKVPLPYGYNVIYYTGVQVGDVLDYNFFGNKDELNTGEMALQWVSEFAGAFNPIGASGSLVQTLSPTVLDPVFALWENKNWYGGRIYPEASQFDVRPPDSELYYRNASDVSKLVAHTANEMFGGSEVTPNKYGMDISPNSLDYLSDFAFGGLGRFVENTGRTVLNAALSPEKLDISQTPFARRVLGQTGDRYIADTYYERTEQVRYLEKERDAMQQLERGTPARTKKEQYIASNYATAERLYTEYKSSDGRISRLRKEKRALQEQKGQVEDKPRSERIRQIDQEIQDEMQRFNSEWNLIEDAKRSPRNVRDLFGSIEPVIGGKTKPEAVKALRTAGRPAMAALMDAMPFRPRAAMTEKYRKELG